MCLGRCALGNLCVADSITAANVSATTLYGQLQTAAQRGLASVA